jgi:hypothetical protein
MDDANPVAVIISVLTKAKWNGIRDGMRDGSSQSKAANVEADIAQPFLEVDLLDSQLFEFGSHFAAAMFSFSVCSAYSLPIYPQHSSLSIIEPSWLQVTTTTP